MTLASVVPQMLAAPKI